MLVHNHVQRKSTPWPSRVWHHLWFWCISLFRRWFGDSRPLTPTADATEAEQVPAAERVVITQRSAA